MRLIVGISGASGTPIAVELLRRLKTIDSVETHLIITTGAELTIRDETDINLDELKSLADVIYDVHDTGASLASGSFKTIGMIIVPCSMKTLAGITFGYCENLLLRAADVTIKENRKLVLVPREMPFCRIHLRNMKTLADCGAIIMPPVMTFHNLPMNIKAQINFLVEKILAQFNLKN